ncbi:MAG: TonB-dependent receptor [Bacteroidales bacterium]|jgi:outer membrane receptor protein involved in Fe transport|nr:TonB-dependent receptor [Bacteroidales bacterium]
MKKRNLLLLAGCVILSINVLAQRQGDNTNTNRTSPTIKGKVIDEQTSEPLLYVNILLLNPKDSAMVTGTATDVNGNFTLNCSYGNYILKFSYVGYKDLFQNIEMKKNIFDAGNVKMQSKTTSLGTTEITAQKSMVEYKLDKRVINIDQNIVTAGGDASDVLQTLPSVSVDEDGNVTLRGNSNVKVLVDGKPSELLGNDLATVLQQIPAASIESVEEITNPSAKYDPEGMSGIINIKLKEKGNRGLNGSVSITGGSALQKFLPNSNASFSINYSTQKYALFAQVDARYGMRGGTNDGIKYLFSHDNNFLSNIIRTKRNDERANLSGGIKLGGDWYINKNNTLTFTYGSRMHGSIKDSTNISNTDLFLLNSPREVNETDNGNNHGQFHNFAINYTKKFNKKEQELTIDANYNIGNFKRNNEQKMDYIYTNDYEKKDEGSSSFNRAVVLLNYVHPFSEKARLEAGYNLNWSIGSSSQDYYLNGNSQRDDSMSYTYNNNEQIHAFYATFGYTFNEKLSAQIGLREEFFSNYGEKAMINSPADTFEQGYPKLYPTLHLSYAFSKSQSAQISYSRRVNRPRGFELLPQVDLSNPEQIRLGNPNLEPEYTDAYEIGYNIIFPKTTIFSAAYYRQTNNGINWFNFLWTRENAEKYGFEWALDIAEDEVDKGKLAMTSKNITKSYNYGLELIIDQEITKWWKINISGNLFGSYADGRDLGANEVTKSFNWDMKMTSTMTLPNDWNIQLSAQYQAARKTIQGERAAQYFADLAVRKSLLQKRASLSLRFSDIFNTRKHFNYTLTDDYLNFSSGRRYSQSISVTFSYRFGETQQKQTQKKQQQNIQDNSVIEQNYYEE